MDDEGPESFADGAPCPRCKSSIDHHDLSDQRDNRGHRIWLCPVY